MEKHHVPFPSGRWWRGFLRYLEGHADATPQTSSCRSWHFSGHATCLCNLPKEPKQNVIFESETTNYKLFVSVDSIRFIDIHSFDSSGAGVKDEETSVISTPEVPLKAMETTLLSFGPLRGLAPAAAVSQEIWSWDYFRLQVTFSHLSNVDLFAWSFLSSLWPYRTISPGLGQSCEQATIWRPFVPSIFGQILELPRLRSFRFSEDSEDSDLSVHRQVGWPGEIVNIDVFRCVWSIV